MSAPAPFRFPPLWHLLTGLWLAGATSQVMAIDWPQEITAPEGTIVVYQPQPEALEGDTLSGRAAIALEFEGEPEPVFGAMWFKARIETDHAAGTAQVVDIAVTRVGWPESKDAAEQRFTAIVESAVPETGFSISLARLSASLQTAEIETESLAELKSEPPRIVFSDKLSVLLLYDGEPRFTAVENSPYERALNTPFLVVRDTRSAHYYLGSGDFWYEASAALGPWKSISAPPAELAGMLEPPDEEAVGPESPPEVVVATAPTELIASDGRPRWQSLPGGELLYVENTETPWLRDLGTGNQYVLLSGRWYRAKSQSGPWTFVPADELPGSFGDIPPLSDVGGLRVSVAGTEEAEEAMLDASIPQTATIARDDTGLTVDYDGEPVFQAIAGTDVAYAENTGAQVLRIDGHYYAVDAGVWFTASTPNGPWEVADQVPEDKIARIPPSEPVYNVTHVHIYESTPEVVYVGYTPGYLWSFPYHGVPVYGTGWHYRPYWGRFYYPQPATWGFHAGYNPWTGWNFGVSWSNGFFSMGMRWSGGWHSHYRPWACCGGWYGGGYRGPTIINTGNINIGNTVNVGNRATVIDRLGNNPRQVRNALASRNLYTQPRNRQRLAGAAASARLQQARPAGRRPNNVFADNSGQVARRVGEAWQTRQDGQWQQSAAAASAQERISGMSDAQKQEARERLASGAAQARERIGGMSDAQRAQAAQQLQQRWQQRPAINRAELNRAHQARVRGLRRELRRPGFQRR